MGVETLPWINMVPRGIFFPTKLSIEIVLKWLEKLSWHAATIRFLYIKKKKTKAKLALIALETIAIYL